MTKNFVFPVRSCGKRRRRAHIRCLGSTCAPLPTYKVSDINAFAIITDLSIPTVTAVICKVSNCSQRYSTYLCNS